jgi:hypothetical protein
MLAHLHAALDGVVEIETLLSERVPPVADARHLAGELRALLVALLQDERPLVGDADSG